MAISTPPNNAHGISFGFIVHDLVTPENDEHLPQMSVSITDETWNNTSSVSGAHDAMMAALESAAVAIDNSLTTSFPSPTYEVHGRFSYSTPAPITEIDPWPEV